MKPDDFKHCLDGIHDAMGRLARPVRIMEVCGTHTVTACRSGLRTLLPENLKLLSGPGCPVCVTPSDYIDRAILLARHSGVGMATFGDLVRVPGTLGTLELEKAKGAEINIVYSALDALEIAAKRKDKKIVFLGVGFETTAPGIAWVVRMAAEKGIDNFAVLGALKTMPHAMAALLNAGDVGIDGFICPGHVSAVIGTRPYEFIGREYHLPCVIAGFEPYDMVLAIEMLLNQIAAGKSEVQNEYHRSVSEEGNQKAKRLIAETFDPVDVEWRGLGVVPNSGLKLKDEFKNYDAEISCTDVNVPARADNSTYRNFELGRAGQPVPPFGSVGQGCPTLPVKKLSRPARSNLKCLCGEVLRGRIAPNECPLFGSECTPATPVGACMVSSEGACAAYFKYCRSGGVARKEWLSQSAQSTQRGAEADRRGL